MYTSEIHAVDKESGKFRILLQTESVKYQYTDVLNYFTSETYNEIINLNRSTQMSVPLQLMASLY